jgi:hypothetical protein
MKVYELLNKPEKWTKGANARASNGVFIPEYSTNAVWWCVSGAIRVCYQESHERRTKINILTSYLENINKNTFIPEWNDDEETTYEEVVATLKKLDI